MSENIDRRYSRRAFLSRGALLGTVPFLRPPLLVDSGATFRLSDAVRAAVEAESYVQPLDLAPARWLWYPSRRCLPNTVVLFRRTFRVAGAVRSARGWLLGDSRYRLYLNGERQQFGPAPADPRYAEADPVDFTGLLQEGANTVGAEVLFYGLGDGTWPIGKPGFIFRLDIEYADGRREQLFSDEAWQAHLCRAWPPGKHKRWYLRAFQEDFDARRYPGGWARPSFTPGEHWLPAMELDAPADQTALASSFRDYLLESSADATRTQLRARTVPPLLEELVPVQQLVNSFYVDWRRPPEEFFECLPPGAYRAVDRLSARPAGEGQWEVTLAAGEAAVLTFAFAEQIVGFPYFTIDAPAGAIIELMVQEGHDAQRRIVMNNHFHSWSRFTCREGNNRFECFDFESLRWLQLHIRNAERPVIISAVGVRRRRYPWPQAPQVRCSDAAIQRVWDAALNTLHNAAQETLVDGMGRERQQYSGDIGHALHALFYAFGDTRLPARFVNTYSQGLTKDGFFLDCWPAYDRLARLAERQLDLTPWGPLLDHGVGFNFDSWYYYFYTGDLEPLREVYPRLLIFARYLAELRSDDGLLPVVDIGVPTVWIDHDAYRQQRHKQCAFNLYAAAMFRHALAPLARVFEDAATAAEAEGLGAALLQAAQGRFWSASRGLFVVNLPWLEEEGAPRYCDRSTATALLYDQCPDGQSEASLQLLVDQPPELGLSYPANSNWRMWALADKGRIDVVQREWREKWAAMVSVQQNNTIQENWVVQPDSNSQWSHCPVAPLFLAFMGIAGLQPLEPGFSRVLVRPQPGELEEVELTGHTVRGPIRFRSEGRRGDRRIALELPEGVAGILELPASESIELPLMQGAPAGRRWYRLPEGKEAQLQLKQV